MWKALKTFYTIVVQNVKPNVRAKMILKIMPSSTTPGHTPSFLRPKMWLGLLQKNLLQFSKTAAALVLAPQLLWRLYPQKRPPKKIAKKLHQLKILIILLKMKKKWIWMIPNPNAPIVEYCATLLIQRQMAFFAAIAVR